MCCFSNNVSRKVLPRSSASDWNLSSDASIPTTWLKYGKSQEGTYFTWHRNIHIVPCHRSVEPCLELHRQEPKDEVHSSADQLRRGLTQPRPPRGLTAEVVFQIHVVSICLCSVVDLQEMGDPFFLGVDRACDLLENHAQGLYESRGE